MVCAVIFGAIAIFWTLVLGSALAGHGPALVEAVGKVGASSSQFGSLVTALQCEWLPDTGASPAYPGQGSEVCRH